MLTSVPFRGCLTLLHGRVLLGWVSLLGALFGGGVFARFAFEDAYITFRYAQNLCAGEGVVFNPGEDVLGTSSPLWTLLLALCGVLGVSIEAAGDVLSTASLASVAYLGGRALQRQGCPSAGLLFCLGVVSGLGGFYDSWGLETPLFLALVLGSFRLAEAGRLRAAGVAIGLATLARYEGTLFALALALYVARRQAPCAPGGDSWTDSWADSWAGRRDRVGEVAVPAALVALPWWVFASYTFGSPFPHTLLAKGGDLGTLAYLAESLRTLPSEWLGQWTSAPHGQGASVVGGPIAWLLLVLVGAGLAAGFPLLMRARSSLAYLMGGGFAVLLGLAILGPGHGFPWHRQPLHVPLALVACVGWSRLIPRGWRVSPSRLAVLVLLAPPLILVRRSVLTESYFYQSRITVYDEVIDALNRNGWTDEVLLTPEPGYIAYHTGNPVIDAAGLVSPEVSFGSDERAPTLLGELLRRRPPLIFARAPFQPDGYRVALDTAYGGRLLRREEVPTNR